MWNVPPHDPALDRLSEAELVLYTYGRAELIMILSGQKRPGASKELLDLAQELQRQADAGELIPVSPKDLGWENEPEKDGD